VELDTLTLRKHEPYFQRAGGEQLVALLEQILQCIAVGLDLDAQLGRV
jgi:hypothetical protein